MLFYSFFKKLVGKEVAVELKNDVELTGKLHSVDQYLNVKLEDVQVVKKERYPQLLAVKNVFIRGSVIRFIQLPASEVDVQLLQDSCRKDNQSGKGR
ncbi:u6 snrna-associated sm-like protein lsm2 [Nannochloropsis oceanica]